MRPMGMEGPGRPLRQAQDKPLPMPAGLGIAKVPGRPTSPRRTSRSTWRLAPAPAGRHLGHPDQPRRSVLPSRKAFIFTERFVEVAPCDPSAWRLERARAAR